MICTQLCLGHVDVHGTDCLQCCGDFVKNLELHFSMSLPFFLVMVFDQHFLFRKHPQSCLLLQVGEGVYFSLNIWLFSLLSST